MTQLLNDIISKACENIPTQVGLNLPKLKKSVESTPPTMKLPKLKSVKSSEGASV